MKTRVLIILSLLVGIGAVLHIIAPSIFGMKPDLLLSMMFLGILLFPKVQYVFLLSIVSGFIAALTTTFPGGEIASMVEKPAAAFVFFGLYLVIRRFIPDTVTAPALTAVGTIVSGMVFLSIPLFLMNFDVGAGFFTLVGTVVMPATLINTLVMVVIYPVVQTILKRSQPIPA